MERNKDYIVLRVGGSYWECKVNMILNDLEIKLHDIDKNERTN